MSDLNSGVFQFIQFVPWKLIPNITGTNGSTWTNGEFFGVSDFCLFFYFHTLHLLDGRDQGNSVKAHSYYLQ